MIDIMTIGVWIDKVIICSVAKLGWNISIKFEYMLKSFALLKKAFLTVVRSVPKLSNRTRTSQGTDGQMPSAQPPKLSV
jgi:hypothetical protein